MKIAISGPGRAGKDIAAEWFVRHCGLRYFGSTSKVIWPHAAHRLDLSLEEAWQRRHEMRQVWRDIGDELRTGDPAYLAREVLRQGDLCVGIRSRGEMEAVVDGKMVDALLWIDRDVPPDPTLEYGVGDFPFVVIPNRQCLEMFERRLEWWARGNFLLYRQTYAQT